MSDMILYRKIPVLAAFLSALMIVAAPAPSSAQQRSEEERFATVRGLSGTVEVRLTPGVQKVRRERAAAMSGAPTLRVSGSITNEWTPLRINMVVGETCEIRTASQSEARIETAEGSIVRIRENTHLVVASMRANTQRVRQGGRAENVTTVNTRIRITEGGIIANIIKFATERNDIRFETETATAAIRGTTVEIDAQRGGSTIFRAFDGTVFVTPRRSRQAVELKHGEMVEIAPRQRAALVRPVPQGYRRQDVYLPGETRPGGAPAEESRKQPASADTVKIAAADIIEPASVKLSLDLGAMRDTLACYADDTINVRGIVNPPMAAVSVNGAAADVDDAGVFRMSLIAPPDSGLFNITIVAENDTLTETAIRPLRVAHVYRTVELIAPAEGQDLELPYVVLNGTAPPGSRVYILDRVVNVRRDGTFSGEIPLPPDTVGDIKVQVEIINRDNEAVRYERNVTYRK